MIKQAEHRYLGLRERKRDAVRVQQVHEALVVTWPWLIVGCEAIHPRPEFHNPPLGPGACTCNVRSNRTGQRVQP